MIDATEIVVIGSGALGSSTAFHLAKAGRDVVLLDKNEIASQTSPRAAGLSGQVRATPGMTRLARRGVQKIMAFTEETGQPMEVYQPGSLKIARRPAHVQQLREEVARGQVAGLAIDFITEAEAQRLMPFFRPEGVLGVTWSRSDIYLEPVQVPRGYAQAAALLGATVLPHTEVTGIVVEGGRAERVLTSKGEIRCKAVVDAAGAWTRVLAGEAGGALGLVPTRHQLMITNPIEGVHPDIPIARVIDCNVYIRPEKGGLMLGGYEPDPMMMDMLTAGRDFTIAQLVLDIGVLRRLADQVRVQFPIFQDPTVTLREHRGGLPTMTPDGHHAVGPVPGVEGMYVISGCNVGGLTVAPALGEALADWIVTGAPSEDIAPLTPRRPAMQPGSEHRLEQLCREHYAHHYWSAASLPKHIKAKGEDEAYSVHSNDI
jgi:glycine/D-amino acid oxidase-like deaminating enzyme